MDQNTYDLVQEAVAVVRGLGGEPPAVGVILGSGLGAFADELEDAVARPYGELPHFPQSAVVGHKGRLVLGGCGGVPVAVMQGRVHAYEGWTMDQVAFGARVLCALGVKALVVTNAAGGIGAKLAPGDLLRITDHINLAGRSPLTGINDDRLGPRFPDLSHAYDPDLGDLVEHLADDVGAPVKRGVYAYMAGPSYETPAEIRALKALGADAVGMSTVPEVVAARHMGVPVVGISVITNLAAGLSEKGLSHEEVKEVADRVTGRFLELLRRFIPAAVAH